MARYITYVKHMKVALEEQFGFHRWPSDFFFKPSEHADGECRGPVVDPKPASRRVAYPRPLRAPPSYPNPWPPFGLSPSPAPKSFFLK